MFNTNDKDLIGRSCLLEEARVHWFSVLPGIICLVAGVSMIIWAGTLMDLSRYLENIPRLVGSIVNSGLSFDYTLLVGGVVLIVYGMYMIIYSVGFKLGTKIFLTDDRIIVKFGCFSREVVELKHSQTESIEVWQSFLGKMFDYGTIRISGTGGGVAPMTMIKHPLQFKEKILTQII